MRFKPVTVATYEKKNSFSNLGGKKMIYESEICEKFECEKKNVPKIDVVSQRNGRFKKQKRKQTGKKTISNEGVHENLYFIRGVVKV